MGSRSPAPLMRGGLRFIDPLIERAFRTDYAERIVPQARLALLMGAALYLGLGWQDLWFFPSGYPWVWLLRCFIAFSLLGVWRLSFRPPFRRWRSLILGLTSLLGGAGPIIMIGAGSQDVAASYYLGLALVIVWVYTISGLRFAVAAATNLILLAAYLLVSLQAGNTPPVWLATNLSNLLATSLLVGFAAYLIERQRRVLFYQATLLDDERRSQEQLALSDHLTGLPNRAYFERRVGEAMRRARRNDLAFALIFVDLDGFKPVNDVYGHGIGDKALAAVALALQESLRGNDTVARLGGDEFIVLLEEVAGRDKVARVGAKLRAAVARPVRVQTDAGEISLQLSASVGVALYPEDARSAQDLLRAADAAMYRDKRARRRARERGEVVLEDGEG